MSPPEAPIETGSTPAMISRLLIPAILAACVGSTTLAQSSLDRAIVGATAPLSEAQKTALSGFIAKHVDAIKDGNDAAATDDARWALVTLARDPAATPTFRKALALSIAGDLAATVKGSDLRRAINAMQVLRFTRTPEGLDLVVERTVPSAETEPGKRIAAASLVADAFEDLDANNAYYETVSRRLKDAATAESDVLALQQKLGAIAAAARRKELPPENARAVRKNLIDAIASVSKAIRGSASADPRMQALQRVLVGVRNDLLEMSQAERAAVSKTLAPALSDLVSAASAQWASAHESAVMSASYGSVMNSCEVLLRLIDRSERASAYTGSKPEGDQRILTPTWDAKDKAKFDAEAKRWADIVGAAPYRG